MVLGAQDPHLVLADRDEAVVVAVLEVDKTYRRALLSRLAVLADTGVLQQQLERMAVVLDQAGAREAGRELFDDLLYLVVLEPGVDHFQLLPQHGEHDDLGETLAECLSRMLLAVAIDYFPLQLGKLVKQWLFDVI